MTHDDFGGDRAAQGDQGVFRSTGAVDHRAWTSPPREQGGGVIPRRPALPTTDRKVTPAGRPDAATAVLPPSLRAWLGLTAALATLVVAALGVLYAGDSGPGTADGSIQSAVDGVRPPWRNVALATDFLGEPAGAAILVVAAVTGCLLLRRPRAAVFVVAGLGMSVATTRLLKPVTGRTIHGGNLAYPSGHTAFATALALVVAMLATGRLGLGRTAGTSLVLAAALVAGAAMGWAEVALGAHYPTDTLGGWCTALAVTPATAWLVDRTAGAGRWACR